MCLAIPAEVVAIETGVRKTISTALLEDVAIGDFVLVHVGYALHKVSPEEASRTLQLMEEAGLLREELEERGT